MLTTGGSKWYSAGGGVGVNGFNPSFRAARSSGVIGTFTPEAIDDCIAWAGVLDVETGAVGVGALAGVTVVVCVSDSYAGSDVGPVDFINSVIDGAGAFACVVEDVLLELLAGVVVVFPLLPPILTVAGFDDDPSRTITYHLLLSF